MMRSLFQRLLTKNLRATRSTRRPLHRKLTLELLENRVVPATILVGPTRAITTISGGVAAAAPGDTVQVDSLGAASTVYTEQVFIGKTINLTANPANLSTPVIKAPAALVTVATGAGIAGDTTTSVVTLFGAGHNLDIGGFNIQGPSVSMNAGLYVRDGSANVHNDTFQTIADNAGITAGNGVGVLVGRGLVGASGTATISNDTINSYSKGGIVVDNNSAATISNDTITGVGATVNFAQNGIQVSDGSIATITNNTISANEYTGPGSGPDPILDTQSAGILLLNAGSATVTGNVIESNDIGIASQSQQGVTISNNTLGGAGAGQANRFEGIIIDQGNTAVTGNVITGGNIGIAAISFNGSTGDSSGNVQGNTIGGTTQSGILMENDTTTTNNPNLTLAGGNQVNGNTGDGLDIKAGTASVANSNFNMDNTGVNVTGGTLTQFISGQASGDVNGIVVTAPGTANNIFGNDLSGSHVKAITNNSGNTIQAAGNWFGTTDPAGIQAQLGGTSTTVASTPLSGPPGPGQATPAVTNQLIVNSYYLRLLGRPADQGGYDTWVGFLNAGNSPNDLALKFEASLEYEIREINSFYVAYLGRNADDAGLAGWEAVLQGGGSIDDVRTGILGSPEYFAHAGGTNNAFLAQLYINVLQRAIDANGQATWSAALAGGASDAFVASQLIASLEGREGQVRNVYVQFLGRPADAAGLNFWANEMISGLTYEQLVANFVSSPEYIGKLNT